MIYDTAFRPCDIEDTYDDDLFDEDDVIGDVTMNCARAFFPKPKTTKHVQPFGCVRICSCVCRRCEARVRACVCRRCEARVCACVHV